MRRFLLEKVPLTPIIPLVVYHGQRAWHIATEFSALLHVPEALQQYQPNFHYHMNVFWQPLAAKQKLNCVV